MRKTLLSRIAGRDNLTEARFDQVDGVGRVINTNEGSRYERFGAAAELEGGVLRSFHVTDNPSKVFAARKASSFAKTYGEHGKTAELGPGLYMSLATDLWKSRSVEKWSFLEGLAGQEMTRLLDWLRGAVERHRGLTPIEKERAVALVDGVSSGDVGTGALVTLATPPVSLAFWKPETLSAIGIEAGRQPVVVEVTMRGRFAVLTRYLQPSESRMLRKAGFDGALIAGGFATTPQMVLWNPKAIVTMGVVNEGEEMARGLSVLSEGKRNKKKSKKSHAADPEADPNAEEDPDAEAEASPEAEGDSNTETDPAADGDQNAEADPEASADPSGVAGADQGADDLDAEIDSMGGGGSLGGSGIDEKPKPPPPRVKTPELKTPPMYEHPPKKMSRKQMVKERAETALRRYKRLKKLATVLGPLEPHHVQSTMWGVREL